MAGLSPVLLEDVEILLDLLLRQCVQPTCCIEGRLIEDSLQRRRVIGHCLHVRHCDFSLLVCCAAAALDDLTEKLSNIKMKIYK